MTAAPDQPFFSAEVSGDLPPLQNVDCYVCGSSERSLWAAENGFRAMKCRRCGLVYVTPRPAPGSRTRALETGLHGGDRELDVTGGYAGEALLPRYRRIIATVYGEEAFRDSRLSWLDIGCGYGEWLETLRDLSAGGMRLSGVEPHAGKAASARARGLEILGVELAAVSGRFDRISLLNVYSHLTDPPAFLADLAGRLAPGGELLLETGNGAEIERAEFPDKLYLPDHLSFASEAILRQVLARAGFTVKSVTRLPLSAPPSGALAWVKHGLKACLRPGYRRRYWNNRCRDLWIRAGVR